MLETYVKLVQTGDHKETAAVILEDATSDAEHLAANLRRLNPKEYEQVAE